MPQLTWEIGLAILGIAISIYFGVKAVGKMRKKSQRQSQTVRDGAIGIQSGRDTKINDR